MANTFILHLINLLGNMSKFTVNLHIRRLYKSTARIFPIRHVVYLRTLGQRNARCKHLYNTVWFTDFSSW